jgi:uncharacterized protein YegP (UPF0339 family)
MGVRVRYLAENTPVLFYYITLQPICNHKIKTTIMFHLFQHTSKKLKGKYDFAFISKGKYICGSNQGYENKKDALKSLSLVSTAFQDDTLDKPLMLWLEVEGRKISTSEIKTATKPSKKYIPQ